MKFETYLPIFNFELPQWEFDYSMIEDCILEDRKEKGLYSEIDFNDLKLDYAQYEKDISLLAINTIQDLLSDFINKIEFQELYKNNVNVCIDIKQNEIKSFIYSHKKEFEDFLKNRYTSYDGFMSHYSNDFETWESETKNFSDFSINGHCLGSILDFIAIQNKIDNYSIFELIYENISYFDYVLNYDEMLNQNDGSLYDYLTQNKINKNFADYLQTSYNNDIINQLCLNEQVLTLIKNWELSFINS